MRLGPDQRDQLEAITRVLIAIAIIGVMGLGYIALWKLDC